MAPRPVLLAVSSDQHAGSALAICPPEGVRLDEGGRYTPSQLNLWLWERWNEAWAEVAKLRRRHKAKLHIVFNGDLLEGRHHQTLQLIGGGHAEAQDYVIERVYSVPRRLKPDSLIVVRGTSAHVGPSAEREESLARRWHATKDPSTGKWSWWQVGLDIHGVFVHIKHHPPGAGARVPWTEEGYYSRMAHSIWMVYAKAGLRPPDVAFRAHLHRHVDTGPLSTTRLIITPGWQGRTEWVERLGSEQAPSFGLSSLLVFPGGRYEVYHHIYQAPEPVPVRF